MRGGILPADDGAVVAGVDGSSEVLAIFFGIHRCICWIHRAILEVQNQRPRGTERSNDLMQVDLITPA